MDEGPTEHPTERSGVFEWSSRAPFQPAPVGVASRFAAANSDGRSYSIEPGRQASGFSRSAGGMAGALNIVQSPARTRSRLEHSTRSLAACVPSRGPCSRPYQAENV